MNSNPSAAPRSRLLRRAASALSALLLAVSAQAAELTVSAASSLTNALRDVTPLFEAAHPGSKVHLNFGASGALLQQISAGAPVDVFISADQERMDQAAQRGLIQPGQRRDIASNELVVIVPRRGTAPSTLADLRQATYARIAIGLPASVPAGTYAREALEQAGLWSAIEPKMVGATNVRQALDYVARGEVDAAFVYGSDVALMPDRVKLALSVPTTTPIRYPAAPLAAAPQPGLARRYVEFLSTAAVQEILARHGFGKP